MNQIINMIIRMLTRSLVNRGINAATRTTRRGSGPTRPQQGGAHQAGRRTRQALNMLRRLGR